MRQNPVSGRMRQGTLFGCDAFRYFDPLFVCTAQVQSAAVSLIEEIVVKHRALVSGCVLYVKPGMASMLISPLGAPE